MDLQQDYNSQIQQAIDASLQEQSSREEDLESEFQRILQISKQEYESNQTSFELDQQHNFGIINQGDVENREFYYTAKKLTEFPWFNENLIDFNYSNRAIIPKQILEQLLSVGVDFDGGIITFEIENIDNSGVKSIINPIEFIIDDFVYLPEHIYHNLNLTLDNNCLKITPISTNIPTITSIKVKPLESETLQINNLDRIVHYSIENLFMTLQHNMIIKIPYRGNLLDFYINTEPHYICKIDKSNMNIIIEIPEDYLPPNLDNYDGYLTEHSMEFSNSPSGENEQNEENYIDVSSIRENELSDYEISDIEIEIEGDFNPENINANNANNENNSGKLLKEEIRAKRLEWLKKSLSD